MFRMLVLGLLMLPLAAHAEIYKWTDAQGRVHFGDKPKNGQKAQEVEVKDYLPGSDAQTREITERGQRLMNAGADAKRQVEAKEAEAVASAEQDRARQCKEAKAYLRAVSGPVIFTDDLGQPIKVTEKERVAEQKRMLKWYDENCR